MAVIKTGQVVSEIRGKLGGTVFSRNRSGAIARGYVKPNNAQTLNQTRQRGKFGTLATKWRGLTAAQQQSFRNAAPNYPYQNSVGDSISIGASQLYQAVNSTRFAEGSGLTKDEIKTISTTPPALTVMSWAPEAQKVFPMWVENQKFAFGRDPLVNLPGGLLNIKFGEVFTIYGSPVVSEGVTNPEALPFRPIWSAELDGGLGSVTVPGFPNVAKVKNIYFFYDRAYPLITTPQGVVFFKMVSFIKGNGFPNSKGTIRVPVIPKP